MPTFNRGYIISSAIKSVLYQSYPHWELIIMDDGSNDDTPAILATFDDDRIHYYSQPNQGPAVARDNALGKARGDFVAYLDSDNALLPNYLETMVDHFEQQPSASYGIPKGHYTHELYINNELVTSIDMTSQFPEQLSITDIFHRSIHFDMNGFMHKRALINEGIQFDPSLPGFEDWDLVMQIGDKYPSGFLYVPEVLYDYHQRYGSDGMVANTSVRYIDIAHKFEAIYQKHRHASLMQGQNWYPERVLKYQKLENEYRAGRIPAFYLYPFPEYWPKTN
jgi:glycosyltransferase involved in cell wall biosynthesis